MAESCEKCPVAKRRRKGECSNGRILWWDHLGPASNSPCPCQCHDAERRKKRAAENPIAMNVAVELCVETLTDALDGSGISDAGLEAIVYLMRLHKKPEEGEVPIRSEE